MQSMYRGRQKWLSLHGLPFFARAAVQRSQQQIQDGRSAGSPWSLTVALPLPSTPLNLCLARDEPFVAHPSSPGCHCQNIAVKEGNGRGVARDEARVSTVKINRTYLARNGYGSQAARPPRSLQVHADKERFERLEPKWLRTTWSTMVDRGRPLSTMVDPWSTMVVQCTASADGHWS